MPRRALVTLIDRAFWLAIGALVALGATSLALGALRRGTEARVRHSREVGRLTREVALLAVDRETGVRGWLITRDERSLAPERAARVPLRAKLDSLVRLTADNPPQQRRAVAVAAALDAWEREFVAPALAGGAPARLPLAGKPAFDVVRARLAEFEAEEDALSRTREARDTRLAAVAVAVVFGELALLLVALLALRRRAVAQVDTVVEQRDVLEDQAVQLEEQTAELEQQLTASQSLAAELEESSAELAESEERFRATFEQAAVGVAHVAPDGRWLRVNQRLAELLGYPRDELLRLTFQDVTAPEDLEADVALARRLIAGEIPRYAIEKRYLRKDGTTLWASLTVSLVRGPDGTPRYFISVVVDVGDRKRAEEELQRASAEIAATSYAIAHDLRSPLRAIDGHSYLLLQQHGTALDEAGREALQRLRANSQRMGHLIDGLLALGRLGREPLSREPRVDLSALARAAVENLRAAEPERRVEVVVADGLAAPGDPRLLATAVQNLVDNAWKFTRGNEAVGRPPACIEVGARAAAATAGDDGGAGEGEPEFYVRDNGVGFAMEYAGQLFRPFQRLHRDDEYAGFGIGLASVRRVIERHGGRVWAEGIPGRGATFHFTLPRASAPTTATPETARD